MSWRRTAAWLLVTAALTAVVTSLFWLFRFGVLGIALAPNMAQQRQAPPPRAAVPGAGPAVPVPAARLTMPVVGAQPSELVDTFNDVRGGGERSHRALDIMAPAGTAVVAAAPGRVEKLFLSARGGKTVYVRSPDGRLIYYYAHLQDYAPGLTEGQQVAAGAPLGSVGSTGDADPGAPHLHFQLIAADPQGQWYQDGTPIDPTPLLR